MKQSNQRTRQMAGFTLVELLAVLLVILVLAGITLGVARYASRRAEVSQARALLTKLDLAIEAFRLDYGYYPTSTIYRVSPVDYHAEKENSANLYSQLVGGPQKYATFNTTEIVTQGGTTFIVDPWGTPVNYYRPISNVAYQISNISSIPGRDYISSTNFYVAGSDNFTQGGMVRTISYDLFSYGPDKKTSAPGNTAWPASWTNITKVVIDDIWSGR